MTSVRGIPVPETQFAILPSSGVPRATEHEYASTVEIEPLADGCRSFEFVFRCRETGALRRWGYQDVEISGAPLHPGLRVVH